MIPLEAYLRDPCGTLSIPRWKAVSMQIPADMFIVHDRAFVPDDWVGYEDRRYFRLAHDLRQTGPCLAEGFSMETAGAGDIETMAEIINASYSDLRVGPSQLEGYTRAAVYRSDLWVLVRESGTRAPAACGIADFDREAGELSLEWIQVLPAYRRRGVGAAMVSELLRRGSRYARFATVSGQVDAPTEPERLYRRRGFTGNDVWHVLKKQS